MTFESAMPHASHAKPILKELYDTLLQITSPDSAVSVILKILFSLCNDHQSASTVNDLEAEDFKMNLDSIFGSFVSSMARSVRTASFSTLIRLCKRTDAYKKTGTVTRSMLSKKQDSGVGDLRSASENLQYLQREAETVESLIGVLPRHEITTRIERLSVRLPRVPQVAFLSYLVCLHHGDYMGALDKLHQYFDQVLIEHQNSSIFSLLPYATLNLAAVHLRFGHIDEALELVREVTANVQRRRDNICLARTLSLLFRLSEHRCDQSYQLQLLQQTLARSLSLCMNSLTTQTMLDTAKHYLLHPREQSGFLASIPVYRSDSLQPDAVLNASFFNESGLSSSSDVPQGRPDAVWRLIYASLSAATRTSDSPTESALLTSQALVASASVWSIYGNTTMATLSYNLQLDIHRTHNLNSLSGPGDAVRGSNLLVSTKLPTHDACSSLCALAKNASENGDEQTALAMLVEAHQLFPQSSSQPQWIRSTRQILQELALRRGDLETAESQAIQLSALSPLNMDLHQHIDALYRLGVVLVHRRDWNRAIVLIQSLIETCEGSGLTLQSIPFRLTLAEIYLRSSEDSGSESGQNASCAIVPLLQCLTLAKQFKLDSIAASATVQLAHIHLLDAQGEPRRAKMAQDLIDSVMPHILQQGPAMLQAQAHLESVKAQLLLSTSEVATQSDPKASSNASASYEMCTSSLDMIEDVIEIAEKLQSQQLLIEAYYFKARIANALGLYVQRNVAAQKFKSLQSSHPENSKNTTFGSMHYYLDISTLSIPSTGI